MTRIAAVDASGSSVPGPTLAIVAQVHGNEPVGGMVLERLDPMLDDQLRCGTVLLVHANRAAAALGRRHTVDGTDLNRLWDRARLELLASQDPGTLRYEEARVLALAPILREVDGILDLHSTSQPTPPFLVVRDDQAHARLVRHLGVERVVTGLHEDGVLGGGVCPDVGLHLGARSPRIGVTFEAGQHSDPDNRRRAFEVAIRFLDHFGLWRLPPPTTAIVPRVHEVLDAIQQAPAGSEPYRFPGFDPDTGGTLASGRPLASFQPVQAGEVMLARGSHTVVRAASTFTLLLPTPTADPGTDLYYVTQARPDDLTSDPTASDAEASLQAHAVEAMLDTLQDDRLARGMTRVSFDRRQVLDQAAEVVMRVLRLPRDHPHRKLTIVGRGEASVLGSEQRAGRRYRQAFRRALADGVPIVRHQLLRGASLGWLEAITRTGLASLLEARRRIRQAEGRRGPGVRLFLSAERPSTVALLVAGDLDLALASGSSRDVRVFLSIEATRVEPDWGTAHVRTQRFALFSGRRPFLRTARLLLQTLREEHAGLVRRPPLSDDAAIQDILGPLDALVPPSDPEHLRAVGQALRHLQILLWRDALRHEVTGQDLAGPDAAGAWLARTVARSGILDPSGIHRWLVDDTGRVDPGRLERPELAHPAAVAPARTRIRPPLCADDVDADTLPRWLGWRRFLEGAQMVPDTRGEDLDLLFEEDAIATRLTRWLSDARALAAEAPGQVMVVMAGDGLAPRPGALRPLVRAHLELLLDPAVRYLRIQHARGSHLRWLKGLVSTLRERPADGAPAGIRFEGEQGSSINVVLLCRAEDGPPEGWTLDGWRVERCVVLVSSLGQGRDETGEQRIGVFSEPLRGAVSGASPELLQFGRAHCQGLLLQGGAPMVDGDAALAEYLFVEQLAGWIRRARDLTDSPFPVPEGTEARKAWLAARLGLVDLTLVEALVAELDRDDPPRAVARAIWDTVVPWPEV